MAESYLGVRPQDAAERLLVNSHVSESDVWKLTKPIAFRWEHKRIATDEARVARSARSIAYFDRDESHKSPSKNPYWLNVTLPPDSTVDRSATPRRLVFLGDRTWPPNAEAANKAVKLWPRISAGIGDAEFSETNGMHLLQRVRSHENLPSWDSKDTLALLEQIAHHP